MGQAHRRFEYETIWSHRPYPPSFFILRRREPQLARPYRAIGHPWLPALALAIDAGVLCLIASADHEGILVAIGLTLLCVPFAMVAQARRTAAGD